MSIRRRSWKEALQDGAFRRAFGIGIVLCLVIANMLPRFFGWIEQRPGRVLHDPLLDVLGPADVPTITFVVLYGTLAIVVASIAWRPYQLLRGMYAYLVMLALRMACMTLFTLEPPPGIIALRDPLTQPFYPGTTPFLKDLFFSGHTATLALMVCLAPTRAVRLVAVAGTVAIALCVLVQHAHWTIDVLVAPFAAWMAWRVSVPLLKAFGLNVSGPASEGA